MDKQPYRVPSPRELPPLDKGPTLEEYHARLIRGDGLRRWSQRASEGVGVWIVAIIILVMAGITAMWIRGQREDCEKRGGSWVDDQCLDVKQIKMR